MTHDPTIRRIAPPAGRRTAFTLAEMMIAVSIMVIVTAVVAGLFVQVRKMIGITQWGAETRTQIRAAVDTLARDLANVNDRAYFLMLNRDYYWDNASGRAARLYRDDPATAAVPGNMDKAFWADRIAFMAEGNFDSIDVTGANGPVQGTSARVYYGHDLWTHELADATWDAAWAVLPPPPALPATWLIQDPMRPAQVPAWTPDFRSRPAITWSLVRQAVIQSQTDTAALVPATRQPVDCEFRLLSDTLDPLNPVVPAGVPVPGDPLNGSRSPSVFYPLYTSTDVAQWIDTLLRGAQTAATWGDLNWAVLLWSPSVYRQQAVTDARALAFDPAAAPARILLPHAARVRFQVRLSDGSVIPQLDETNRNPYLRGGLAVQVYPGILAPGQLSGLNPDYTVSPASPPWTWDPNALWDATKAGTKVRPAPAPNPPVSEIPLAQTLYTWTPDRTNLRWTQPPTPVSLYPVAVRICMEVYDPQHRTPDPIRVDEWIPVRWASKPPPAP